METLALPMTFANGRPAVHVDTTDEYYGHILSICIGVEPNELPLTPSFGVDDPAFASVSRASIIEIAARYVPEITITSIDALIDQSGDTSVDISFYR